MKLYYYSDKDQQLGPFTLDELKPKRLKKSTLVWTDGMSDWAPAETLDELKEFVVSEPPPLPKKESFIASELPQIKQSIVPKANDKYDLTYEKDTGAIVAGFALIFVLFLLAFVGNIVAKSSEIAYPKGPIALILVVIRIFVTFSVVKIASRQNRDEVGWGFFAFLTPAIALIIIGSLRKLQLRIELDSNLSINQQVSLLINKANQLYSDKRFQECIEILNKVIELDPQNLEAIKSRALSFYMNNNLDDALKDFKELNNVEKYVSISSYYLGHLALKKNNRDKAIEYWLIAKEKGSNEAEIQLNLYNNYTGKYLLNRSELINKLGNQNKLGDLSADYIYIYSDIAKYRGGILQIDENYDIKKFSTLFYGNENGLDIKTGTVFKTFHIAISFYEISDIYFDNDGEYFNIQLLDNNIVSFYYDQAKDYNKGLKSICTAIDKKTGTKLSVLNSLKD